MSQEAGEFIFGSFGSRLTELLERIRRARSIDELVGLAPRVRALGREVLALDSGPVLATRLIAQLNDLLAERVVMVCAAGSTLPSAAWCWLSLGSEGRAEQTFVTDQDNGLVFADTLEGADALRRRFLPFAREANDALAACGFPLCAGRVMAGNPEWCLALGEWQRCFLDWITVPEPQALLNASIFFDFRALCGDASLAARLRARVLSLASGGTLFLLLMTRNALQSAPPLGLLDRLSGRHRGRGVDLKQSAARLFVDAARVLGLKAGLTPVNTVERLRSAAEAGVIGGAEAEAAVQAFVTIQRLRLGIQRKALLAGQTPSNRLRSGDANDFEQRVLYESLRQARRLQQALRLVFRTDVA